MPRYGARIGIVSPSHRLPDWFRFSALPLLLPALAAVYLSAHWSDIPPSFPTHWGISGQPNGWSTRTPLHVFALPIFAEGLCLWLLVLAEAIYRSTRDAAVLKCMVAAETIIAIILGGFAISPLVDFPMWVLPVIGGPLSLIVILWFASQAQANSGAADPNALFVPKTLGMGYTINMNHPKAWPAVAAGILPVVLLVLFLIWAL